MGTAVETRTYERQESVVFCKTNEEFGGLSNMAPGFPLRVNGIDIRTSEALYQACRFPHLPDVQRLIIDQKSPMTAKMKSKPYRSRSREDWEVVRIRIMRWSLRVKLACNWTKFRDLLLATGDRPVVEESRKDDFWGAKARSDGTLAGANVLGRLLMELRDELRGEPRDSLLRVEPPPTRNFLLYGKPILVVETGDVCEIAPDLFTASAANQPPDHRGDRVTTVPPVAPTPAPVGGTPPHETASSGTAEGLSAMSYPRRLIEVDLPIKEISAHARRDRRVKVGHISRLHMWWARRPLAACRAVILAALWPDPADPLCPERFRVEAAKAMKEFRDRRGGRPRDWDDPAQVRAALLDFIAEFANWDNSTNATYLEPARRLVQVAHESLGGAPGTRPLVVDPFAGGGAIPLEALRVGADAFASDLNPVAVLLNKVVLEYIPKHGSRLAEAVRFWGRRLREQATASLARYYPTRGDGAIPLAYIWARTLRCEGPACGFTFPLLSQLSIVPKKGACLALDCSPDLAPRISVATSSRGKKVAGTVRGGAVTCPKCDFTIPASRYRERSARGDLGRQLVMVVLRNPNTGQREYRSPTAEEVRAEELAVQAVREIEQNWKDPLPPFPHEEISRDEPRRLNVLAYGFTNWRDIYTPRQLLAMHKIAELLNALPIAGGDGDRGSADIAPAVRTCLALAVSNTVHYNTAFSTYLSDGMISAFIQSSSIPMRADFAEANPLQEWYVGGIAYQLDRVAEVVDECAKAATAAGQVHLLDAAESLLPDHSAQALVTDPPYYYAIPYADLSDLFYVWLKRLLSSTHPELFRLEATDKVKEATQSLHHSASPSLKDSRHYEGRLRDALSAQRKVVDAGGIAVVVFANAETQAWEALLGALIGAGWVVTAAWPIDTERAERMLASRQRTLASSVHLACRPRFADAVGDWRGILSELPTRLHEWMPRLAKEGVVGADAIFACLGPALEIFSRYSRVEKASGERVELREYLEQIWAAVAREALSMIFEDADATGLEEDARLTAMWLWTLSTNAIGGSNGGSTAAVDDEEGAESDDDEEEATSKAKPSAAFSLEFDAARKIAQGLGAHLEDLGRVVEVKGDKARLLSVAERTRHLFGKDQAQRAPARRAKKVEQLTLFEELEAAEKDAGWGDVGLPPAGDTTLDRVHQAMVLFAAGRGEALKRFLVEEGVGRAATFWKLAQSLSALYPAGTDEKRWVDGVLVRKKGLGFG